MHKYHLEKGPVYKTRRRVAAAVIGLAIAGGVGGTVSASGGGAKGKAEAPAAEVFHYRVQPNDTLTEIVDIGRPDLEEYSDEFNQQVVELTTQLNLDDQGIPRIRPGEELDVDASVYDTKALKDHMDEHAG